MKKIEITAEWILGTFPVSWCADGDGNMNISTDNYRDSIWIDLALDSMDIYYERYETDIDEFDTFETWWEFRLEAIKGVCPELYEEWLIMDFRNSANKRKN